MNRHMNRRLILAVAVAATVVGVAEWARARRRPYLAEPWPDVELLICHDDGELIAADMDDAADLVESGHWSYF